MRNNARPVLVIDNYDSFAYNLVQYMGALGAVIEVRRNDKIGISDVIDLNPAAIVISPGPCTPDEAGISIEVIQRFGGVIPLLGICLGHQAIGRAFGGNVIRVNPPVHGKTSEIFHDGLTVYRGIAAPFVATRYHSLILDEETLPDCLTITARTQDGIIMGVRHKDLLIEGLQFHPESILTPAGMEILANFLLLSGIKAELPVY